jgi:hypothetical protein
VIGCDKQPAAPPAPQQQASDIPPASTRPTTQELIQGARKRAKLQVMPFSVEVPSSWTVKPSTDGQSFTLSGPGPRFDYEIHLALRPAIKSLELPLMLNAATRESAQRDDPHYFSTVRKLGDATVLERMVTEPSTNVPLTDVYGQMVSPQSTPIRWRIALYISHDQEFTVYELSFFDLSAEQYDIERPFLRAIVDSLQQEPGAM